MAKQTLANFIEKASRLYEQEREDREGSSALGMYVRRWNGWVKGGMGGLEVSIPLYLPPPPREARKTHQANAE